MAKRPRPPWCGECHQATRLIGDPPKRCPKCHPLSVRLADVGGPSIAEGVIQLSDVTERRMRWLWKGRLPRGHLIMLDGDPGIGKSTLALDFAARITAGDPWPDGQACERGNVLIMTAEEGLADTVLPRMRLLGGDTSRTFVLMHVPGGDGAPRLPALPLDIPYIEKIIAERRIVFVIIDVFAAFLGGEVDSHADAKIRRALFPLFQAAQRMQCTFLLIRHLKKDPGERNAMYRGGGSIGLIGQARAALLAAYDPDDRQRRIVAWIKVSNAMLPRSLAYSLIGDDDSECAFVQWYGEDPRAAGDLLGVQLDPDEREEQDATAQWIQDYLFHAGGEASGGQILTAAAKHGLAKATVQRARKRAGVTYRRTGWQSGTIWQLDPAAMRDLTASSASSTSLSESDADEADERGERKNSA